MTELRQSNRIYLTYKARIKAESRYKLYSQLANAIIIWYSFLMIVASLAVSSKALSILYYETIFASGSIAIFASSIFLATGVLEKKALEHRDCYLELQGIWNSNVQESKKMQRYGDALPRYPNHSSRDDSDVIFTAWRRGGELFDSEGKVPFSFLTIVSVIARKLAFWLSVAVFFLDHYGSPHIT
jgi:SMODS and SLOG-associating 2TM effector domain family 5